MLYALLAFSILDVTPETVSRLRVAWTFHTRATPPDERSAAKAAFEASPVLARGLLYVVTPYNQVIALDPEKGLERWRYDPRLAKGRSYSEVTSRGVAVSNQRLFFGTLDARVICLDARNGRLLWGTRHSDLSNDGNYQITSPPAIVGKVVVVGSSIGDNSRAEMERGTVRAYDVNTGKLQWTWDPTPPGKTGAANAWSFISADAERGLVFVPTGSASPDFYGGLRPGDNHHANSVVALRASTGQLVWSFQVVHHDLWDYDVAARPELVTVNGKSGVTDDQRRRLAAKARGLGEKCWPKCAPS